jgi:antitoxin ParD1/3/4
MATIEKISIALPQEMADQVRRAVERGEYSSHSEVVRDALREWTLRRNLREEGLKELRRMWRLSVESKAPGVPVGEVFSRLRKRYSGAKKTRRAAK